MKKSFIVIGLGRFGASVAKALSNLNCDILCMDISEECVSDIASDINHCVIGDSTKLATLKELGVASIDHAVVAIGNNLEASILTPDSIFKPCIILSMSKSSSNNFSILVLSSKLIYATF